MSTQAWAFNFESSSDATFRATGSDFAAKLALIGLVQTADTGQINWGTATRPTVNNNAGYEIWRFDDTLQATAPIFLKIIYGTDNEADRMRVEIQVGTGSNGSGTLTGTVTSSYEISSGDGNMTGTSAQSYFCHVAGFLGLVWGKEGPEANLNWGTFFLTRTCDSNGAATGAGCHIMYQNGPVGYNANPTSGQNAANASIDFTNSVVWEATTPSGTIHNASCIIPGYYQGELLPGGDTPIWLFWGGKPDAFPVFGLVAVHADNVAELGTFTASPIGSGSHTYLCLGDGGFNSNPTATLAAEGSFTYYAMIWE